MRIVVAMSGGVDSSVAAALLAEQGHEVIGLSMQLYDQSEGQTSFGSCCSIDDLHDARRVAAAINIPHYIVNFERQFDEQVVSNFIREYESRRADDRTLPPLHWQPVPLAAVPIYLTRAVILAEDARFYQHSGFDLIAFEEAMNYNLAEGRMALGASTISQQTVKNLFLSSARNPLRKWHELVLTWGLERNVSKRRILELYLNIAEFGSGVYGVQAAAQTYFGTSAGALTIEQAAKLVASLPAPERHNPATHTGYFDRRSQKILNLLVRYPGDAAEVIGRELRAAPPESRASSVHAI